MIGLICNVRRQLLKQGYDLELQYLVEVLTLAASSNFCAGAHQVNLRLESPLCVQGAGPLDHSQCSLPYSSAVPLRLRGIRTRLYLWRRRKLADL